MFRRKHALIAVAATWSCVAGTPAGDVVRETLPNGAVLIRHMSLPATDALGPEVAVAEVDLKLGVMDGDPNFIFGNIRGIEAASDGTIYVLDYQAVEVRTYGPDGQYLETIVGSGEGPGEISEANGIFLSGDSLLWINDHGKMAIIGVTPEGEEIARFPFPVRGYGYIWRGTFDHSGRFWMGTSHSDEERTFPPETGLVTGKSRGYYKSYDIATEAVDSVYTGENTYRSFIAETGGGYSYRGIPFEASTPTVVDPSGGFWEANTAEYRITRTDEDGDTLLVIEAALPVTPVTAEDRSAYVDAAVERDPDDRRAAEEIAALMPDTKPILSGLFVDDEGRLWVRRVVENDGPGFYDLFSQDGEHLGSVRLGFDAGQYATLWVRHGSIYTRVEDELDVPYVVRAPIPELR